VVAAAERDEEGVCYCEAEGSDLDGYVSGGEQLVRMEGEIDLPMRL